MHSLADRVWKSIDCGSSWVDYPACVCAILAFEDSTDCSSPTLRCSCADQVSVVLLLSRICLLTTNIVLFKYEIS